MDGSQTQYVPWISLHWFPQSSALPPTTGKGESHPYLSCAPHTWGRWGECRADPLSSLPPPRPPTMGKKKRGKRNTANNTAISHDRVAGHDDEQCDTILNCMPDKAECGEPFHIDECNKSPKKEELLIEVVPTTTTTTSVSVGDTVKIKGLVNAPEYNGRRGVIVSELDATTNRCGVRITGKNSKVMV